MVTLNSNVDKCGQELVHIFFTGQVRNNDVNCTSYCHHKAMK